MRPLGYRMLFCLVRSELHRVPTDHFATALSLNWGAQMHAPYTHVSARVSQPHDRCNPLLLRHIIHFQAFDYSPKDWN